MSMLASVLASVSRLKDVSVRAIRKMEPACRRPFHEFCVARIDHWMKGDVWHGELNGSEAAVSALKLAWEERRPSL
jgi:hypothetical protein